MMQSNGEFKTEEYKLGSLTCRMFFDEHARVCAVVLKGSLDTQPVMSLQRILRTAILPYVYNFIVDLHGITFVGSTGLGLLMNLVRVKRDYIYVSYPDESISKPFRLLGVNYLFRYYVNVEELQKDSTISSMIIEQLRKEVGSQKEVKYHDRWIKILSDFLTEEQLWQELQLMDPYVHQAEYMNELVLPSEDKYACILFRFMSRVIKSNPQLSQFKSMDDDSLELIAKEIYGNAVHHGYEGSKDGVIEISYTLDSETLTFTITDYGRGFSSPPDEMTDSIGLQLIRKIFDRVEITEAPRKQVSGLVLGKGTMVRMVKAIKPS